ncbi:hypothetical protein NQ117_01750 [Paenibacillus sp. SC116]|uniref:hypothetical protein n=1 Tax=Paenibacillus sp. SC116 TaxID=2968986 RepID=UPI00215B0022|nr:hypothetical protein [Paenibacillus sp. SC116]MCR8842398.1 hypothetical protein [Paenibacillus sp. SC116]
MINRINHKLEFLRKLIKEKMAAPSEPFFPVEEIDMRLKTIIRYVLFLIPILSLISCLGSSKNIKDAIDWQEIHDDFSILHTFDVENGHISLFERTTYSDIGIAYINKSRKKSLTSINGYLSQKAEAPEWIYSSGSLGGGVYSIYYGRLDERPNGKVFVQFNNQGLSKEATLIEASSSMIWVVIFDERFESKDIRIMYK